MTRAVLMAAVLSLTGACTSPPGAPSATPVATLAATASTTAVDSAPTGETAPTQAEARLTYQIVPEESEARFIIDEVLAGSPNTVVGTTTAVSGEIVGSFSDPQGVSVGPVRVDLRELRTDNGFRNRALHDAILQTGAEANRFAIFEVTSLGGLPDRIDFGTSYPVSMTGNLTIHGVTLPLTFEGQVAAVSPERLEGTASVTVPYADFGIRILRLPPQVASVSDDVTLEIDFAAVPA